MSTALLVNKTMEALRKAGKEDELTFSASEVNNADEESTINVEAHAHKYEGLISGSILESNDGRLEIKLAACKGDIFVPAE